MKIKRQAAVAAGILVSSLAFSTLNYAQVESPKNKENSHKTLKEKAQKKQSNNSLSNISGQVQDEYGAVVAGVKITLRDYKTGKIYKTESNDKGIYKFNNLESANYEIEAVSPAFEILLIKNIKLNDSQNLTKNLTLKLSADTDVVGELIFVGEPVEQNSTAETANKIQQRKLEELPKPPQIPKAKKKKN